MMFHTVDNGMYRIFCYGSNLDVRQLLERCPGARFVQTAVLRGARVDFVGWSSTWKGAVATIRRAKGSDVHGVIVEIDAPDLQCLDAYEGAPHCYSRQPVSLVDQDGERISGSCFAYVANDERCPEGAPPSAEYVLRILGGYRFWRFPASAARDLVRSSGLNVTPKIKPHRGRTARTEAANS